jgi:hypothetical protein
LELSDKLQICDNKNKIVLTTNHKSYFRITNMKNNSYYVTTIFRNLVLGINNEEKIILYRNKDENNLKFQWNIIKIDKKKYFIIINKYNNKILEVSKNELKFSDDKNLL